MRPDTRPRLKITEMYSLKFYERICGLRRTQVAGGRLLQQNGQYRIGP
jgi:hypothetical protein